MSIDAKHMMLSEFGARATSEGTDFWNFGTDTKTIKLSLVILVYLYANDDGKISFSENHSFKKTINSVSELSRSDKNEIIGLLKLLPDKNYVIGYISGKGLSNAVVIAAINFLKGKAKLGKKHVALLRDIETSYKN